MKCWFKALIVLIVITALLNLVSFGALTSLLMFIPAFLFELLGFDSFCSDLNCKEQGKLILDRTLYFAFSFWVLLYGLLSWLICKIKSFSKGNNNE